MHFRCTGVCEADFNACPNQRSKQAFRAIQELAPERRAPVRPSIINLRLFVTAQSFKSVAFPPTNLLLAGNETAPKPDYRSVHSALRNDSQERSQPQVRSSISSRQRLDQLGKR